MVESVKRLERRGPGPYCTVFAYYAGGPIHLYTLAASSSLACPLGFRSPQPEPFCP